MADALSQIYSGDLPGTVRSSSEYTKGPDEDEGQVLVRKITPVTVGQYSFTAAIENNPEKLQKTREKQSKRSS